MRYIEVTKLVKYLDSQSSKMKQYLTDNNKCIDGDGFDYIITKLIVYISENSIGEEDIRGIY